MKTFEDLTTLPLAHGELEQNALWSKLCGKFRFERATTYCYYQKGDDYAHLIASAKFGHKPWINEQITKAFVQYLREKTPAGNKPWPSDIDVIVPVPVHWLRLLMRGYNQVTPIAHTLGKEWQMPVISNCLYRKRYVKSQVGVSKEKRIVAESSSFAVRNPRKLEGKHLLLVDDVCTTGSTISACADVLLEIPGVRVSVLTLAVTI